MGRQGMEGLSQNALGELFESLSNLVMERGEMLNELGIFLMEGGRKAGENLTEGFKEKGIGGYREREEGAIITGTKRRPYESG
jgi:hypothetical protein